MSTATMRLQKYLAQCGIASRRAAEELIQQGKVFVNGHCVTTLGTKVDPEHDKVRVGKKEIELALKGIILFHKPKGVVSTLHDPEGRPCIADYLTSRYRSYFPVGRLDFESTGLVILTNDGDLAERLLHPRYEADRVYEIQIKGDVPDAALRRLEQGLKLEDGLARAEVHSKVGKGGLCTITISIREGRNRMVRRMFEVLGFPTIDLTRISHGPFQLSGLKPGQIRKLSEKDYSFYRKKVLGTRTGST